MPVIRYKLQVLDDVFWETDTFNRVKDTGSAIELIAEKIVRPLQKKREMNGEPTISLLEVEIVNPYVHLHDWRREFLDRNNLRANYVCDSCGITGFKRFNPHTGENKVLELDPKYQKEKYTFCKDKLKEMPKKLEFKF